MELNLVEHLIENPIVLLLALATAIFGVGRLTRVITYDSFPPAVWARKFWVEKVARGGAWGLLAECFWCATPWVMAVCIGWGWFSSLHWTWWVFWGWLGISYLASMVIARDGDD